ncbi:CpXC domain-containing protein [Chloroflexus sp.]|uniref:CpXC domain-containing protein n=1 Tax=Chloroflexus sp. TaxID=1904827 RepID=UPI00298F1679|nr:CpXC domain-containing protein [Chloroflexus sp.]MDW8405233.1 CpXC domain-containing protein [Chloroflexus sp.]
MPISYREQAPLTCPHCGVDFSAEIWLIIDAEEEPEAAAALRREEVNIVACPHCGARGPAGAPLLYHDARARRVLFAPAPGAADHEIREQARELHALLVGSIEVEQRRPYLADVDIAQDMSGLAHLLRRIDARRRAPASPPPSPSPPPTPVAEPPPLLAAVEALLAADTATDLERVLAKHPELLEPATIATLTQLAEVAAAQGEPEIAQGLRNARDLLAGMSRRAEPERLTAIPPAAMQELLSAHSDAELEQVIARHPVLLRPEIDELLAAEIETALASDAERLAQLLEARRSMLAAFRTAPAPAADLEAAIEALLVADDEETIAQVIDQNPILLSATAEQALWEFAAEARAGGDEELARHAIACRELLRRVRAGLEEDRS